MVKNTALKLIQELNNPGTKNSKIKIGINSTKKNNNILETIFFRTIALGI